MSNPSPLVLVNRQTLLAVDPLSGVERWRVPVDDLPTRLFIVDQTLLVTLAAKPTSAMTTGAVLALELATGKLLGRVDLPFRPTAGAVHDQHLFLVGADGAACLTSAGQTRWLAGPQRTDHLPGVSSMDGVVARDASGRELWRLDTREKFEEARAGLAIGGVVAQPDLR